jgi:hypothetical protein
MLSTPSLDVLISISKHAALAPFVRHVIIGLDHYTLPSAFHSWTNTAQFDAYRRGWADQYTLMSTGRDREMLAEAFQNLPNLETIGIRDFSAEGRIRESDRWRSYGAPTVYQETGIHLAGTSSDYASRVYTMMLQALSDTMRIVPSVEVILRMPNTGLSDFAFFVPAADMKLQPVLNGLRTLLLTLNLGQHLSAPVVTSTIQAFGPVPGM